MKVGPHLLMRGDPDATYWIREGKPSVVKLVDKYIPDDMLGLSPAPIWIGRIVNQSDFDPNNPYATGFPTGAIDAARTFVSFVLDKAIINNPSIMAWELNNEPVISSPERMLWHADFLAECARILREVYNRVAVIGNWSVGNPDVGLWKYYVPALHAARKYSAVLGRHSYGPITEDYALRHRRDNRIFTELGYPDMPMFIGECGMEYLPGVPQWPWRIEIGGNPLRYAGYLEALDIEYQRDKYVIGASVFTYGSGWQDHSMNGSDVGWHLVEYARMINNKDITVELPKMTILHTIHIQVSDGEAQQLMNLYMSADDYLEHNKTLDGFVWPPQPPIQYRAKSTRDLLIRDAKGNPVPAPMDVIRLGEIVNIYKELGRIGPNTTGTFYDDRVSITPDDLNVWKTGLERV